MTTKILRYSVPALVAAFALGTTAELFAGGGGGGGGGGGRGGGGGAAGGGGGGFGTVSSTRDYPNSTMMGPVSVSVDPETGGLIVITDDKTFLSVTNVIHGVDQPKPQVLIKVVFLEVLHDNALDIGMEGTYNFNTGSSSLATNIFANLAGGLTTNIVNNPAVANLGQNFGLAQQGTVGSTIAGNTMPTGAGIYSVLGNDYNATVRAIQSANNLEVLSRPSILVRNNQPATINIGQSVPIITSVTYAANTGQPIVTPTYTPVGITLQVTPFIKGSMVEMIVAPSITALSSTTVQIAPGYNAPVIDTRQASTVVVVPDGQTAIIGGLMENDKGSVDTKIPILGDIPLLGMLFKRTQRDHTKKELLIFLTPHVALTPTDLAAATTSESQKAEMARRAFSEKEFDLMLDTNLMKHSDKSDKH